MKEALCATLRVIKEGPSPEIHIESPHDIYNIMKFLEKEDREKIYVLHLDAKNRILTMELVSVGSLTNSLIHPREVFKGAIINNSATIILCHNHPSGDVKPSKEDLEITKKLSEVGDLLDISLIDHIIIGNEGYYSIKTEGFEMEKAMREMEKRKQGKDVGVIKKEDMVSVSFSSVRELCDMFSEFSKKVWFLENSYSEGIDSFHKNAKDGFHFFFSSILDEMEEIEDLIDSIYKEAGGKEC